MLVLFAGVALLFTTRYPRGIFDFVLGLDRWVARVAAYVLLMRDEYPPFRLDQGGTEASEPAVDETTFVTDTAEAPPATKGGGGVGRVVLIVVGIVAAIVSFGLLAGGCALVAVDQTQRDDDGFLMSPSRGLRDADVRDRLRQGEHRHRTAPSGRSTRFLGTVRIRSESDRAGLRGDRACGGRRRLPRAASITTS